MKTAPGKSAGCFFFNFVIYNSDTALVKLLWLTFLKQLRLSTHMDVCYNGKKIAEISSLNVQNGLRSLCHTNWFWSGSSLLL